MGGAGEDFDVNFGSSGRCDRVDPGGDFLEGDGGRNRSGRTGPAVEFPLGETLRDGFAAFAFHVFADVEFDGLDDAVGVFSGSLKCENFLHGAWE